jgi:hypothetical protein
MNKRKTSERRGEKLSNLRMDWKITMQIIRGGG